MSFKVRTQSYSGPFDLLLQLVTRQKVTIGSISISEVANQYLAEVERAEFLEVFVELVIVVIGFARCLLRYQRGGLNVQKGCSDQQKVTRHI